jgi:hypothetical protein
MPSKKPVWDDTPSSVINVGFEVLTAVVIKISIFWDKALCNLLKIDRYFGETCGLHVHGRRISQGRSQRETGSSMSQKTELFSMNRFNINLALQLLWI